MKQIKMGLLSYILANPLTRGLDLDDPNTSELRKQVILQKSFLRKLYKNWYLIIQKNLTDVNGKVLELGTGAGFLRDYIPNLITSDVMPVKSCNLSCSAVALPFSDSSLGAMVMLNVLHHIQNVNLFFDESSRCLKKDGKLVMIEPWLSPWSRFIYTKFHHEPFEPEVLSWELPDGGPLSGGNDALPWIIFHRDLENFEKLHPSLELQSITPGFPICYLISGGLSMRSFAPGFLFNLFRSFESNMPTGLKGKMAMFATIILCNSKQE